MELLGVAAIFIVISILAAAAFPAIGRAHALTAGGDKVANLALLARQNSLAKNAMTALVVVADSNLDVDFRAFTLFELVPRADGTPVGGADWKQLGRWETLPEGIVVDQCGFDDGNTPMNPPLPDLIFQGSKVERYRYVVFLPIGRLLRAGAAHARLAQGTWSSAGQAITYLGAKASDQGPANYYDIAILAETGRLKIDRP